MTVAVVLIVLRAIGRLGVVLVFAFVVRLQESDKAHEQDTDHQGQEKRDTVMAVELDFWQQVR